MSTADDVKQRLAQSLERSVKRAQFDELARIHHWKDAAKLSAQLDGPMPTGVVVSLAAARARQ